MMIFSTTDSLANVQLMFLGLWDTMRLSAKVHILVLLSIVSTDGKHKAPAFWSRIETHRFNFHDTNKFEPTIEYSSLGRIASDLLSRE